MIFVFVSYYITTYISHLTLHTYITVAVDIHNMVISGI